MDERQLHQRQRRRSRRRGSYCLLAWDLLLVLVLRLV